MKKLVAIALVGFLNTAWAQDYYNIDVVMADGSNKTYTQIASDMPTAQFAEQIAQDFPDTQLISANATLAPLQETPVEEPKTPAFCSSTGCKVAVGVGVAALLAWGLSSMSKSNYSGNCQFEWQTAKDGSRCGGRAASVRPGGY